jgi:hypothetical protein
MRDEFDVMLYEFLSAPSGALLLIMADWLEDHPESVGRPLPAALREHAAGGWVPADLSDEFAHVTTGVAAKFCWNHTIEGVGGGDYLPSAIYTHLQSPPMSGDCIPDSYTQPTRLGDFHVEGGWGRQRYRSAADAFTALWFALESRHRRASDQ